MAYYQNDDFIIWSGTAATFPYPLSEVVSEDPADVWMEGGIDLSNEFTAGAAPVVTVVALDQPNAMLSLGYLADFYYRIWVIPTILSATNPSLFTDIAFQIWNAYPEGTNTLSSIVSTGDASVALQFSAPVVYRAVEIKDVALQITAPTTTPILANYTFTFTSGSGDLEFRATSATTLSQPPEAPVTEEWEFNTGVMVSNDGSEQRFSLLSAPRRRFQLSYQIDEDVEWREQFGRIFLNAASEFLLPLFPYMTGLDNETLAGETRLYYDPAKTDVRAGENVYIWGRDYEQFAEVVSLYTDGCEIDFQVTVDVGPRSSTRGRAFSIAPVASCLLSNKTRFNMKPVNGLLPIAARSNTIRSSLSRPDSSSSFTSIGSKMILDRRPLANSSIDIEVDHGGDLFDFGTGYASIVTSWDAPKLSGNRTFRIHRFSDPAEMDWWRDFLEALKGPRVSFRMPTWRPDIEIVGTPANAASSLVFLSSVYSSTFFSAPGGYDYLRIETSSGVHYAKVTAVAINSDGNDVVTISPAVPSGAGWQAVERVSLMPLVRLGGDTVTLRHGPLSTDIEMNIRSAFE